MMEINIDFEHFYGSEYETYGQKHLCKLTLGGQDFGNEKRGIKDEINSAKFS